MTTREKFLLHVGVAPHLGGFQLLVRAAEIYSEDPYISITKELYPKLAEEFGTKASCVERRIRHAISYAADCSAPGTGIWAVVGNTVRLNQDKPTNSSVISALAMLSDEEMEDELNG